MGKKNNKNTCFDIFEKIGHIVALTEGTPLSVEGEAKAFISSLAEQLKITPIQALLLAVFVNQSDDHRIRPRDIANHFGCSTVNVLARMSDIEELTRLRALRRIKSDDGSIFYRVPNCTLEALRLGRLPKREKLAGLTLNKWFEKLTETMLQRINGEIDCEELEETLCALLVKNQHLPVAQRLKALDLYVSDMVLYLVMAVRFINYDDDCIVRQDFSDFFSRGELMDHCSNLGRGEHNLQKLNLVECNNNDGQADACSWCLTKHSKKDIFAEFKLPVSDAKERQTNLTNCTDIKAKQMYYNDNVSRQVNQLKSLLEKERMAKVLKRLNDKGLRKGFTCLFYGGPGTGKTETVLQLARLTGRDVMMVDVPSIRSKWVGETERNIKDLFDRYRKAVSSCEMTPILVFNEADALLNKRMEGGTSSVDKMENAMQDIILQEMENLEGILIATTNLTGSLDSAFERRFLYKIEFEKPSPNERCHIWKSLLTDLSDEQSMMLAKRFDFSGGQIENIARKRIIADILDDNDTLNIEGIIESCNNELLNKKRVTKIGFGLCG